MKGWNVGSCSLSGMKHVFPDNEAWFLPYTFRGAGKMEGPPKGPVSRVCSRGSCRDMGGFVFPRESIPARGSFLLSLGYLEMSMAVVTPLSSCKDVFDVENFMENVFFFFLICFLICFLSFQKKKLLHEQNQK